MTERAHYESCHGETSIDGSRLPATAVRQLAWSLPDEIWILQINPRRRATEPRSASEIRDRRNELDAVSKLDRSAALIGDLMARAEAEAEAEQFLASLPVR
jgi:hypothetical protein